MRHFSSFLLFLALLPATLPARSVARITSLEGDVLDSLTRKPIPFAPVQLTLNGVLTKRTQADSKGHYAIPAIAAAHYQVLSGLSGYHESSKSISLKAGEINTLDFLLGLSEIKIPNVGTDDNEAVKPVAQNVEQNGTIRGTLYDKASGEPILFATVYLIDASGKPTHYAAQSDINGFFSLTKIPAGMYSLIVKYIGYKSFQQQIRVEPGKIATQQLYIEQESSEISEIEITTVKDRHTQRSGREKDIILKTDDRATIDAPQEFVKLPQVQSSPKRSHRKQKDD